MWYIIRMPHYTCTECGGVSEKPGTCQDPDCLKQGQELTACDCTDGEHGADYDEDYYAR
jgi:hypothetical protein